MEEAGRRDRERRGGDRHKREREREERHGMAESSRPD